MSPSTARFWSSSAISLVAMITGVALIIDGGYVYAQQRGSQNGSDAASNAGARSSRTTASPALGQAGPESDADVAAAVSQSANRHQLGDFDAYYTNVAGCSSTRAAVSWEHGIGGTGRRRHAAVGCARAWRGLASRSTPSSSPWWASTAFSAPATATTSVSGYVENAGAGNVLPITIPLSIIYCENNGDFATQQPADALAAQHAP